MAILVIRVYAHWSLEISKPAKNATYSCRFDKCYDRKGADDENTTKVEPIAGCNGLGAIALCDSDIGICEQCSGGLKEKWSYD